AKYGALIRPSVSRVMRSAVRCAPVPRPGRSRGQVDTITISIRLWAIAGAASVETAAAEPAATLAFFRNERRSIILLPQQSRESTPKRLSAMLAGQPFEMMPRVRYRTHVIVPPKTGDATRTKS